MGWLWGVFLAMLVASPAGAAHQTDLDANPPEEIGAIQKAIARGDAAEITRHASAYVEVSIHGATTMHSRAQTAYILKAFFRDYPPDRFSFERKMRIDRDWFIYGAYRYRGESRPQRIEILLRWSGEHYEIKKILIEQVTR